MTDVGYLAVLVFQGGILGALLVGVSRRNVPAVGNAIVSFGATLLPFGVEAISRLLLDTSAGFGPELPLWIAVAGCLHSIGMLGPYDSIWWWDHLTHAVSAALVAALLYAGLLVTAEHWVALPFELVGLLTVLFTFVVGIFWELLELVARDVGRRYDVQPVLVHYGLRDTAYDLVFDVLGALVVVLLDVRLFVPIADRFPTATTTLIVASAALVIVGFVAMILWIEIDRERGAKLD